MQQTIVILPVENCSLLSYHWTREYNLDKKQEISTTKIDKKLWCKGNQRYIV